MIGLTVLYGVLAGIDLYLMMKYAREGVAAEGAPDETTQALAY